MAKDVDTWLTYTPKKPEAKTEIGPVHVISLFNQKGGVGKTTSTISLAASLAEFGRRVLVVDFDPQGSLTVGLTGNPDIAPTVYDVLLEKASVQEALLKTRIPGVDLVPAGIDLSVADLQLASEPGREYALQRGLAPIINQYDYVLIDCLPSLGLLALNALATSESLIIPLQCEFYALKGITLLQDTLNKVQSRINPKLSILGILPTMVSRSTHHREALERVIEFYGDLVFHTAIPDTVKFSDATKEATPITIYASSSPGAEAYRKAAAELIERVEGKK
jgi:chromosome partitioning protein